MRFKTIQIFIAILFLSSYSVEGFCQSDEEKTTRVKIGQEVPAFSFSEDGGPEKSIADLKGQVVLINFFATWCGPCLKELPHLQNDIFIPYKDHPEFRLLVIGREHTAGELAKFKQTKTFTFKLIADPKREIYSSFAEQFIPRNFLIDRDGTIIYSSVGFDEKEFDQLKSVLEAKLKK